MYLGFLVSSNDKTFQVPSSGLMPASVGPAIRQNDVGPSTPYKDRQSSHDIDTHPTLDLHSLYGLTLSHYRFLSSHSPYSLLVSPTPPISLHRFSIDRTLCICIARQKWDPLNLPPSAATSRSGTSFTAATGMKDITLKPTIIPFSNNTPYLIELIAVHSYQVCLSDLIRVTDNLLTDSNLDDHLGPKLPFKHPSKPLPFNPSPLRQLQRSKYRLRRLCGSPLHHPRQIVSTYLPSPSQVVQG